MHRSLKRIQVMMAVAMVMVTAILLRCWGVL
jgi:hypothetical protein